MGINSESAFLSYLCFCLLFSHVLLSFVLDHDSIVSVSLFIICFLCLRSLEPTSYWVIEIVVPVM